MLSKTVVIQKATSISLPWDWVSPAACHRAVWQCPGHHYASFKKG